MKKTVVFSP